MIQTKPEPEIAEVSLFGPGVGECLVIHYGDGRWFIVDSCLCPNSKQPIAIRYLKEIGVDPTKQVKGIVLTHWHRDHIEGAYKLLKTCESATLYVPSAMLSEEALHLVALFRRDVFSDSDQEIKEYRDIVHYLRETGDQKRFERVNSSFLFFDDRSLNIRMVALSPSEVACTQSIVRLQEERPKPGERRKRLVAPMDENLNAVALHFSFGGFSVLLGSDLEETDSGNINTGWSAVIDRNLKGKLSLGSASLFKIPHHGSKNGHHTQIWSDFFKEKPVSITTPFLTHRLPKMSDIERITELSSKFIITKNPDPKFKPKKKTKSKVMVERWIKQKVSQRCVVNDQMGHIQIRASKDGIKNIGQCPNCVEFHEKRNQQKE